jgi:CheY-like chemotaxis protein
MAKADYSGKSILVVDDNEPLLRRVKALVRSFGIKDVRTASNGLDALHECKTNPPDVVLLDIIMPVVNGWEVLRELRKIGPNTRVIIFSVRNDAEAGLEAARLGATDYITKAELFETAELKIKRALAHGTPISQSTTTTLIRNYIEQLAVEIAHTKNTDSAIAQKLKELAETSQSQPIDKKRALGALRFIEDALTHAMGHGVGHGAIRGIEKLLDLL